MATTRPERINQTERGVDGEYYWRRSIPHYDTVKWYILDGDGFDDENWEGGDYMLACRIALHLTASRYQGLRDPDFIPTLGEFQ